MTVTSNVLKAAVEDLLVADRLPLDEALDRHFAPEFRQRVDGRLLDRAAFGAAIEALRREVRHVRFDVIDELADGDRYAQRHVIELLLHDGQRVTNEVYVFGRRDADGRFLNLDEVSLPSRR